jgi:hypothetical protein
MLIPLTLPPPVREFVFDGLRLLVSRFAALTEEFRAGLIAAVGRTLADGAEYLMDRVIPQSGSRRARHSEYGEESCLDSASPFDESHHVIHPPQDFQVTPSTENRTPMPLTRALIAAGLNALGVWLLRVGFVPTSAVIAMLGGMVLMFRPSK